MALLREKQYFLADVLIYFTELAKKNKGFSTGMSHFYKELLQRSSEQHDATVAATKAKGPTLPDAPNLTITKPKPIAIAPNPTKSDAELARLAREEGKDIELNDDNQIVDKRELLSAGLNLSAPNTRRLGAGSSTSAKKAEPVETHRAVGTAASKREIRERQQRELERQMREEQERSAELAQKEAEAERERSVKRKNTEDEVNNARARYLERKRQKMEGVVSSTVTGQEPGT